MSFQTHGQTLHGVGSITSHRFAEAICSLKKSQTRFIAQVAPVWLDREYERFELWAASLGLRQPGHGSLEYRLRDAEFVQEYILVTLNEINEYLKDRKIPSLRLDFVFREHEKRFENRCFSVPTMPSTNHSQTWDRMLTQGAQVLDIFSGKRVPYEDEAEHPGSGIGAALAPTSDDTETSTAPAAQSSSEKEGSDSPSDSTESSLHEAPVRYEAIIDRIDNLFDVAFKIRNPATRPSRSNFNLFKNIDESERAEQIEEREATETRKVGFIYEQESRDREDLQVGNLSYEFEKDDQPAEFADFLIRRIGKANARRRQQFSYWRDHARRIANESRREEDPAGPVPMQGDSGAPGTSRLHLDTSASPLAKDSELPGMSAMGRSKATSATRLDPQQIRLNDRKSVVTRTSRVSTAIGPSGETILWPDPPQELLGEKHFTCPYCSTLCPGRYLERDAWK